MSQTDGIIYIVGPRRLQNELMASWLERETGAKCLLGEDIYRVRFPGDAKYKGQRNVVLWDCQGKDDILIIREENGTQRTFEFDYSKVGDGKDLEENIYLKPGDTVVVP